MSTENVMPTPPPLPCPSCGNIMRLISYSPTCETVIYDYLCSNDGGYLSWRPRRVAANTG